MKQEIPLEIVSLGLAGHRVETVPGELLSPRLWDFSASAGLERLEMVRGVRHLLLQRLQLHQSSQTSQAAGQLQAEAEEGSVVDDVLQEGGEPLGDPGLAPVQGADHDAEPGVADLVGDLDEVAPVISSQQARGEKEEVRRGQAEATKTAVNHEDVQPGEGIFGEEILGRGQAGGQVATDGLTCSLQDVPRSYKSHCRVGAGNGPAGPAAHGDGEGGHREGEDGVVVAVISQTTSLLQLGLSLPGTVNVERSSALIF